MGLHGLVGLDVVSNPDTDVTASELPGTPDRLKPRLKATGSRLGFSWDEWKKAEMIWQGNEKVEEFVNKQHEFTKPSGSLGNVSEYSEWRSDDVRHSWW